MNEGVRAAAPTDYVIERWTGDDRTAMHRIRDAVLAGEPLPVADSDSASAEVIVVGGGIAGMTVAARLANPDILLLEREDVLGGNAKSGEWQGIRYSKAAAYLVATDGVFGELYRSIGLDLPPVPAPADSLVTPQSAGRDILVGPLAEAFEKLRAAYAAMDVPPSDTGEASPEQLALDQQSFADFMARYELPQPLTELVDSYCRSAMGTTLADASAYVGANFYSEIATEVVAFPGGNGFIAEALAAKVKARARVQTGAAVYAVTRAGDGFHVHAFVDGRPVRYAARKVVVATPYYFARHILDAGVGADAALKDAMALEYSAYLVAQLCFEGRVETGGYDHWTIGGPDGEPFHPTDYIQADWVVPEAKRSQTHSVISVYVPMDGWGRGDLDMADEADPQRAIAQRVVDTFYAFFPVPASATLKEVRLSRYGHQFLASTKGAVGRARAIKAMAAEKLAPGLVLAHSDGQGMPAIESAIIEALAAVKAIEG